ncbi:MAG TPA: alpha-amylase family glycosyl hydrolase [Elusimicrobiales bacterium]|nr:alpha-amylase family glycosyl hydrolase [Elusimicrobiales bacterium]
MRPFNDSVMYFAVVDRFFNSDPANDKGNYSDAFDPARKDWYKYWGGDLAGIIKKLDYLKELGCSSLWLTPLFDQADGLVDVEGRGIAAYHGYWAKDFKRLDEHLVSDPKDVRVFASKDTILDRLTKTMHEKDMRLVLDIVCNHSSPTQRVDAGGTVNKGELYDDGKLLTSYDNDKLGWYHRGGGVDDWNNKTQVENNELCGLADFNESQIGYRTYIKDVMKLWLDKGVDAFRVDTVKHMPNWFWQEFVSDMLLHRPGLFIFGEWFMGGCNDDLSVNFANRSGMGILDFSLQRALEDCLARGAESGFEQVNGVFLRDSIFDDCRHLVTFLDNHDMPRFMSAGATPARLEMGLALILTCRGIPCVYYGTEQYLHNDTNGGADPYNRPMMESWDTTTPAFRLIKKLAKVRRENTAVQHGSHRVKHLAKDVYAYTRVFGNNCCLAVFNRGEETAVNLETVELPDGVHKDVLSGKAIIVKGGRLENLSLPADSSMVFSYSEPVPAPAATDLTLTFLLNGFKTAYGQKVKVTGSCPELGCWDLAKAPSLEYINENLWLGDLPVKTSAGRMIAYKFVVTSQDGAVLYENRPAHFRHLPKTGFLDLHHSWS